MERYFKVIQVITLVENKVWNFGNCTKIIPDSMLCQFVERELHEVCQIDSCDNCWLLAVAICCWFLDEKKLYWLLVYIYNLHIHVAIRFACNWHWGVCRSEQPCFSSWWTCSRWHSKFQKQWLVCGWGCWSTILGSPYEDNSKLLSRTNNGPWIEA